jgi:uncharacterized membrane protein YcfT
MRLAAPTPSMSDSKIPWIDVAKGICIILVVMLHSTFGVVKDVGSAGIVEQFVHFAAPFRMPDFFLLSGLLLGAVINRPWMLYLDRKVVHFAYFYLLWLTIQFAFKGPVIAMHDGPMVAIGTYLTGFIQPFGTLWFVYVLPIFFVVTKLLASQSRWLVFFTAAILYVLPIDTGMMVIDEFANRFVFFFAGYAFAPQIFVAAKAAATDRTLLAIAIGFWACLNQAAVTHGLDTNPVIGLLLGFAGAAAIIGFGVLAMGTHFETPLRWLGANSIVIYLAFFAPMALTREALIVSGITSSGAIISLIVTLAAVGGPVLLYLTIQKTGYGHFLFTRPEWAKLDVSIEATQRPIKKERRVRQAFNYGRRDRRSRIPLNPASPA